MEEAVYDNLTSCQHTVYYCSQHSRGKDQHLGAAGWRRTALSWHSEIQQNNGRMKEAQQRLGARKKITTTLSFASSILKKEVQGSFFYTEIIPWFCK